MKTVDRVRSPVGRRRPAPEAAPGPRELAPVELRKTYDPALPELAPTAVVAPPGIIGQHRAAAALRFGLGIEAAGFHIYAAGPAGTGKMTTLGAFLEELAARRPTPDDLCYVADFDDPTEARALRLPAGEGRLLRHDVRTVVAELRREIPRAFQSDEYAKKRDEIVHRVERQRDELTRGAGERAAKLSFFLQPSPAGLLVIPKVGAEPMKDVELAALDAEARADLNRRKELIGADLEKTLKEIRRLELAAQAELEEIDRSVAGAVVRRALAEVEERHAVPAARAYLQALEADVLGHVGDFKERDEESGEQPPERAWFTEREQRRYDVNVLVDHGKTRGAPVVIEWQAGFPQLFGRLEKETRFGSVHTDFTLLRAGALHRANGGYLVVPASALLRGFLSWSSLKRALRSGQLTIEDPAERLGLAETRTLRPEPVALEVKVVLVGHPSLFYLLHALDEDFAELFKVRADFDTSMPASPDNIRLFASFLRNLAAREACPPLDEGAIAALLEHAARKAGDQERLSTHFGELADCVREAAHWAREEGQQELRRGHVKRALAEKRFRAGMLEEHQEEWVRRGTLLIDTRGEAVGQVNALAVIELADSRFGRPARITASAGPGAEGIVDIEREVELSGPIHSKGVLILSGFLLRRFGRELPLSLGARLTFEQSYEGIDGDSASSAELFALLSAIAGVPLRQGIAVTGSVNQDGMLQAVGGVNEKIEGFFAACSVGGLDGRQGVLIPASNVSHLMLRDDVVEAVAIGHFHVYAAQTIEEGLALLTGLPAAIVLELVGLRLAQFARLLHTGQRGRTRHPRHTKAQRAPSRAPRGGA